MKHRAVAVALLLTGSAAFIQTTYADQGSSQQSTKTVQGNVQLSGNINVPLTLEQANKWAQENSYTLKVADRDLKRSSITLENASEELDYVPTDTGDGQYDNRANSSAWKNYTSSNSSYLASRKQIELAKDQVYYSTMKSYQDVLVAENNVKNEEEALEISRFEERIALAKYERGKLSENSKEDSIQTRIKAEQSLVKMRTQLQKTIDALNIQMARPKGTVYQLVDRPVYRVPVKIDIEVLIQRLSSNNLSISRLQDAVKSAELNIKYAAYEGKTEEDKLLKMDVDSANEELTNGKKEFAESLRSMYANLLDNQEQYQQMKDQLQIAKDALELSRKKWERGLIIELEFKSSQLKVSQLQRQMEELVIQMNQIQYTLDKPWSA